jgi:hypothetical protein
MQRKAAGIDRSTGSSKFSLNPEVILAVNTWRPQIEANYGEPAWTDPVSGKNGMNW